LAPNDLWLFDPNIPHSSTFENDSEMLAVKIPRALLETRLGKIHAVTAQPLRSAVGQLTSSYLQTLVACAGGLSEGAELIQQQVLDLVGLAASDALRRSDVNFSSSKAAIVHRLRSAASVRLSDPALRPHDVADAAGVSVRYANLLLNEQGTSLGRLILTLRLERCRAALSDDSQRHRSITDIALAWGFSDLSHFSRVFAKAYGLAPRDYREAQHGFRKDEP
jgi:AraC-like DNA-binding protein